MKILLFQTSFLGDVILSTPVIESIRRFYPTSQITVLTTPQASDIVRYHPDVSKTIVYDKRGKDRGIAGFLRMVKFLRKQQFKVVFSLHKSWRTALLLYACRIPQRIGFSEASGAWLYTKRSNRSGCDHDVLRNLSIFRVLGYEPEALSQKLQVHVPEDVETQMQELLRPFGEGAKELVGIAPGSVWATKRWPPAGFGEVTRQLYDDGYAVVLLGGKSDMTVATEVEISAKRNLLNLTGKTSLLQAAAIIQRLKLLITNDSAPLHLASAFQVPVVALFCSTVPEFGFGPWKTPSTSLGVSDLYCRPCGSHGRQRCPTGTLACQRKLLASQVVEAAKRLLRQPVTQRQKI